MEFVSKNESTNNYSTFWTTIVSDKKVDVKIEIEKLIDFCSKELGFYNYVDGYGNFMLVKLKDKCIIEESRQEEIKQAIKHHLRNVIKDELVWSEFAKKNYVNDNFVHLIEKLPQAEFNFSTKNNAFFFYRNGVVKVTQNSLELILYKDFKKLVWKQQINNRDFNLTINHTEEPVFKKFLLNVCGNDPIRYQSLMSLIGYILHPYKDPSLTKAVILLDERVDFSGLAHGGTGKSLIAKAIEVVTSTVWKDGKKYNANHVFAYDDIRTHHRVLYFDDVKKDFNFEYFFSLVTGNVQVQRKFKDSILIPFSLAPKLLISSNYMVRGNGGDTDERRRIEFEVSPHYSKDHKPIDEFKHRFFDDWNSLEWQLFDHLMLSFVSYYIQNGIINPPSINLKENKLIMLTDLDFVTYMDSNVQCDIHYNKADLIEEFREHNPTQKMLSARRFKDWIDYWADFRGLKPHHFKSNGNALVVFQKIEDNEETKGTQ